MYILLEYKAVKHLLAYTLLYRVNPFDQSSENSIEMVLISISPYLLKQIKSPLGQGLSQIQPPKEESIIRG